MAFLLKLATLPLIALLTLVEWLGIFALGISQFITNKLAALIFFIACCCSARSCSEKPQPCSQGASASLSCRMPSSGFGSGFPISIGLLRIGCADKSPHSLHCLLMVYAFS